MEAIHNNMGNYRAVILDRWRGAFATNAASRFSLSPGERAGVRANLLPTPSSCAPMPNLIALPTRSALAVAATRIHQLLSV